MEMLEQLSKNACSNSGFALIWEVKFMPFRAGVLVCYSYDCFYLVFNAVVKSDCCFEKCLLKNKYTLKWRNGSKC